MLGQSVSALSHRILFFRFRLLNDTFVSIYGAVKAKSGAVVILRLCANLGHGWSTKIASAGGGRGRAKALKGWENVKILQLCWLLLSFQLST